MSLTPEERLLRDIFEKPVDEYGRELGYCNSCGEEALLDTECCDDGEVVEYDEGPA